MRKFLSFIILPLLGIGMTSQAIQAQEQSNSTTINSSSSESAPSESIDSETTTSESKENEIPTTAPIIEGTNESNYQFKDPNELITEFQQAPEKMSSLLNIMESKDGIEYSVNSLATVKDDRRYYILSSRADGGLASVLIETDEKDGYQRAFYLAEDLAKFAAEILNQNYERYQNTIIEDYYIYAQEHFDEMVGTYIEQPAMDESNETLLKRVKLIDHGMLELISQYVATQSDKATVHETEYEGVVYVYNIDQQASKMMAEIAANIAKENEELQYLVSQLNAGYIGTLSFSMKLGNISLSLASEEGNNVIEYRAGLEQATIKQPNQEKIIKGDDFVKQIGIDIFSEEFISSEPSNPSDTSEKLDSVETTVAE